MAFGIRPRTRGYDELYAAMEGAVPPGTFYDFSRATVMWSSNPQGFILATDSPNIPVRITRERLGDFDIGVDQGNQVDQTTIVPQQGAVTTLFYITLGRGRNRLTASEILPNGSLGRTQVLEVIATTNTLIYESFGREMYKSVDKIKLLHDAIFSPYATRLLDQLAGVGNVLPDLQTLKILSTKMLIRAFIHFPATELGLDNKIEAVTLNTPIFRTQRQDEDYQVEESRVMRAIENLAGSEGHVWFPNLAVTRWLAFIKMANSFRNNFTLLDVRDDVVRVEYKGSLRYHYFDYDSFGQNFLTNLSFNNCFRDFEVGASIQFLLGIKICCWTYPFDMQVTAATPIGASRPYLDSGVPFDSGIPFDADPTDPWNDGFIGWSYSGRFEMDYPPVSHNLDTMVQPSANYSGPPCVYNGPYTQLLNSNRSDTEFSYVVTAEGEMDDYVGGPVVGLAADFNNTPVGVELEGSKFTAGVPILVCVKYVDSNGMINKTGSGIVQILEPVSGVDEFAPVSAGFVYIYVTLTQAGTGLFFTLSDGTYTNNTQTFSIVADVFNAITVEPIANQSVGVPFAVTVQAVDQYGNPVTDVGFDTLVQITPQSGIDAGDPTPLNFNLVNGQATVNLTCNQPGTGELKFQLGAYTVTSNTFTVS